MKRFSENGARPVSVPGEWNPQPFGRLGALVFQPNNSDTLYWASLWAPTRIAGCALGSWLTGTCWENVDSEKRLACGRGRSGPMDPTPPPRRFENNGGCADSLTISFSLWTVVAKHAQMNSRQKSTLLPRPDASAIHGQTERSGCTAAEPYPLSRSHSLRPQPCHGQAN
jgi:hypothetical protein